MAMPTNVHIGADVRLATNRRSRRAAQAQGVEHGRPGGDLLHGAPLHGPYQTFDQLFAGFPGCQRRDRQLGQRAINIPVGLASRFRAARSVAAASISPSTAGKVPFPD